MTAYKFYCLSVFFAIFIADDCPVEKLNFFPLGIKKYFTFYSIYLSMSLAIPLSIHHFSFKAQWKQSQQWRWSDPNLQ